MIPYMHVNAWLVLITFLQHTDPIVREWLSLLTVPCMNEP